MKSSQTPAFLLPHTELTFCSISIIILTFEMLDCVKSNKWGNLFCCVGSTGKQHNNTNENAAVVMYIIHTKLDFFKKIKGKAGRIIGPWVCLQG